MAFSDEYRIEITEAEVKKKYPFIKEMVFPNNIELML